MCPRKAVKRKSAVNLDSILERIAAFNEAAGGGVRIQRQSNGISLYREDNGRPIARLRPFGEGDRVEVLWWSHRGKWEQIGDMGPVVMSLEEALSYISRDSIGVFWG
jgi:hypothetical protein